jgi:signal transduction histidine kinase
MRPGTGREKDRVLVVDDSAQNRLVARGHLEAAGYEVAEADSGERALELLERGERVDLVILDVLMPGIGGFATCRRIRTTPAIAETPVLFLTALGDREATTPALEAGGDDLLPKPFHRAELLLRCRALIRQRETTRQLRYALDELTAQNEQLRRAEHDKQRISQLIVHDLKGPIGAALANADLLLRRVPPEHVEMIEDIRIAMQQLDRTARGLLDLSRAETGDLEPDRESFAFADLASEVAAAMRGLARWSDVTIELDVHDGTTVVADRELMRRLLQNLVHNALKHAPRNSKVTIASHADREGLLVCVIDRGPGVPADDVARIFEPGVTLEGTPARKTSHGLGLAFCRLAAEAHGGRVWVEQPGPDGAGIMFCVRIPQAAS